MSRRCHHKSSSQSKDHDHFGPSVGNRRLVNVSHRKGPSNVSNTNGGVAGKRMHRICFTEEDKVNCSFYFKVGACRHGERCSRRHVKQDFSQTLLLSHFYMPPVDATVASEEEKKRQEMIGINAYNNKPIPHGIKKINESDKNNDKCINEKDSTRELEDHYYDFYEDVINEMIKYGDVEELVVCKNSGDHMVCLFLSLFSLSNM